MDHPFLFAALECIGINGKFLEWLRVLHNNQESCVINEGISTGYFSLERGCRQGDPISAYMFIIIMEIFFTMIKANKNINVLEILGFKYHLTSYADDTTFFIKDTDSIFKIFKTFDKFSDLSGQTTPNL